MPRPAQLVTVHLAGVAAMAALLSAVTLLACSRVARWLPEPRRLPLVVAWTAATGAVSLAIAPDAPAP